MPERACEAAARTTEACLARSPTENQKLFFLENCRLNLSMATKNDAPVRKLVTRRPYIEALHKRCAKRARHPKTRHHAQKHLSRGSPILCAQATDPRNATYFATSLHFCSGLKSPARPARVTPVRTREAEAASQKEILNHHEGHEDTKNTKQDIVVLIETKCFHRVLRFFASFVMDFSKPPEVGGSFFGKTCRRFFYARQWHVARRLRESEPSAPADGVPRFTAL